MKSTIVEQFEEQIESISMLQVYFRQVHLKTSSVSCRGSLRIPPPPSYEVTMLCNQFLLPAKYVPAKYKVVFRVTVWVSTSKEPLQTAEVRSLLDEA